jgi:hypothetical protein
VYAASDMPPNVRSVKLLFMKCLSGLLRLPRQSTVGQSAKPQSNLIKAKKEHGGQNGFLIPLCFFVVPHINLTPT